MSRAQLYRKIKELTGQSVKEFLPIIRLKKSAELLLQRDCNVSEVAYQVGFNSLPYFTKSFRAYFQQTPTQYIARHRPVGAVNNLHPE
jgi:AraC-like DNA-binding protein